MALDDEIRKRLFGPKSKFNVGDSVQLLEGGPLMVVTEVFSARDMTQPLIDCKWFDSETKTTRTNLFSEKDLKAFDWNER